MYNSVWSTGLAAPDSERSPIWTAVSTEGVNPEQRWERNYTPSFRGSMGEAILPGGEHGGRAAAPKWAGIRGSGQLVLANLLVELAESRTCGGLTTTAGNGTAVKAATGGGLRNHRRGLKLD